MNLTIKTIRTMKKTTFVMMALVLAGTLPATAQFGKLLGKGKSAGKKSGSFATVWESEFDNKASRLALCDGDGQFIIGTDDNSATVLDAEGKTVWSGDYKKITTNKTNNSEYQYTIWKDKGGYLFLFDKRSLGADRVAVLDLATGKELWNSELYQDLIPKGTKALEGSDEGELETVKYIDELDSFLISQRNSVILVKAHTGEKFGKPIVSKVELGNIYMMPKRTRSLWLILNQQLLVLCSLDSKIHW